MGDEDLQELNFSRSQVANCTINKISKMVASNKEYFYGKKAYQKSSNNFQFKIVNPSIFSKSFLHEVATNAMGVILNENSQYNIDIQVYWWLDRFKLRKPKYFNRVHTGYEWNRYNQTHYDAENPPPKMVMGYKFNIFYPD